MKFHSLLMNGVINSGSLQSLRSPVVAEPGSKYS